MDKLERAHRLHTILQQRRSAVSVSYLCDGRCKTVSNAELDKTLTRSFGIFSGEPTAIALLYLPRKRRAGFMFDTVKEMILPHKKR